MRKLPTPTPVLLLFALSPIFAQPECGKNGDTQTEVLPKGDNKYVPLEQVSVWLNYGLCDFDSNANDLKEEGSVIFDHYGWKNLELVL